MKKGILLALFAVLLIAGCYRPQTVSVVEMPTCSAECNETELRDFIESKFGLTDYDIECSECVLGRAGSAKAIISINRESAELYHREGWCSPGGADCGWEICYTTYYDNLAYDSVKTRFCNKITSNTGGCKDSFYSDCGVIQSLDNTNEMISKCLAGEFEKIEGNKKTLAIKQVDAATVVEGNFDCWNR